MNERAYLGAAEAYIALGQTDEAIAILERGLASLPNSTAIRQMLEGLQSSQPEEIETIFPDSHGLTEDQIDVFPGSTALGELEILPYENYIVHGEHVHHLSDAGAEALKIEDVTWASTDRTKMVCSIMDTKSDGFRYSLYLLDCDRTIGTEHFVGYCGWNKVVDVSSDGDIVYLDDTNNLVLYRNGESVFIENNHRITDVVISTNGKQILYAVLNDEGSHNLRIWDTKAQKESDFSFGGAHFLDLLGVSDNAQYVYALDSQGRVHVLENGQEKPVTPITMFPVSDYFYYFNSDMSEMLFLSPTSGLTLYRGNGAAANLLGREEMLRDGSTDISSHEFLSLEVFSAGNLYDRGHHTDISSFAGSYLTYYCGTSSESGNYSYGKYIPVLKRLLRRDFINVLAVPFRMVYIDERLGTTALNLEGHYDASGYPYLTNFGEKFYSARTGKLLVLNKTYYEGGIPIYEINAGSKGVDLRLMDHVENGEFIICNDAQSRFFIIGKMESDGSRNLYTKRIDGEQTLIREDIEASNMLYYGTWPSELFHGTSLFYLHESKLYKTDGETSAVVDLGSIGEVSTAETMYDCIHISVGDDDYLSYDGETFHRLTDISDASQDGLFANAP